MLYDAFTFYNEFDLLELRLNVLDGVADRFVLVEGDRTFANGRKALHFTHDRDSRFDRFIDRITVVTVTQWPEFTTAWGNEAHQRNSIMRGLSNCADDDVIMISDVDEIPAPEALRRYRPGSGIWALEQYMFYYAFNNLNLKNPFWSLARIMDYRSLKHGLDRVEIRSMYNPNGDDGITTPSKVRLFDPPPGQVLKHGGWHFSYLMSAEEISKKIQAFSHQEFNSPEFTDVQAIKKRMVAGEDLFKRRKVVYAAMPLDGRFPACLARDPKYAEYILPYSPWRYWPPATWFSIRRALKRFSKALSRAVKKLLGR